MGTPGGFRQILEGLKEARIDLVAGVPDVNLLELITLLYEDEEITHVSVGSEEEGIGVCGGAYLGEKRAAMSLQNGGLMDACNGITTTAHQFGLPILLLVYYAGDIGDNAFHMLGLLTEPVLRGPVVKYTVLRDPNQTKEQITAAATTAEAFKRPVALILTRGVLSTDEVVRAMW